MIDIYKPRDIYTHRVYLAGPFFTPKQIEVANLVEELSKVAKLDYFSPRTRCYCPPDATMAQRKMTFDMNTSAIEQCDLVLACIDDYDAGTMWEMGYAHAIRKPVISYSMVPGRGLNLMLAQGSVGFVNGAEQLAEFLGTTGLVNWDKATPTHKGEII